MKIKTSSGLIVFSCIATLICGISVYGFFNFGLLPFIEMLLAKRSSFNYDFRKENMVYYATQSAVSFLLAITLAIFANIANRNEKGKNVSDQVEN